MVQTMVDTFEAGAAEPGAEGIIDLRDDPVPVDDERQRNFLPLTRSKDLPEGQLGLLALDLTQINPAAIETIEDGRWLEKYGHYSTNTVKAIWTKEGLSLRAIERIVANYTLWSNYPPMGNHR